MPEIHDPGERTPAMRGADHASLGRLTETLVPALVAKLSASGLGELEVREGDWRVRLRRPAGGSPPASSGRRGDRPRAVPHPSERDGRSTREAPAIAGAAAAGSVAPDAAERRSVIATSPAVGVFRTAAAVGARVRAGDRIGFVDLLGIPQDVVSPIDGTLTDVLVEGGEVVEYGEPLAAVQPDPAETTRPSASPVSPASPSPASDEG